MTKYIKRILQSIANWVLTLLSGSPAGEIEAPNRPVQELDLRFMPLYLTVNGDPVEFRVYGGPFSKVTSQDCYTICLAEELVDRYPHNATLPIRDFSVPALDALKRAAEDAIDVILSAPGKAIAVGCMGGIGRTGLFMAAIKVVWDARGYGEPLAEDAVGYVRTHYLPYAVETPEQQAIIKKLRDTY